MKSLQEDTIKTNYRPVSNLSFICKIVKKCTLEQSIHDCYNYGLLSSYQSAYWKFYSHETSLMKLINELLWAMENHQVTSVVILDLSAAFNTVDHKLLLHVQTKRFGISGSTLKWYSAYLKLRTFRVCINGCYSSEKTMHFSVPQEPIQGAFLFMTYASTIPEIIPNSLQLNGYADDHSLRKSFKLGIIHEPTNNTNIDDETCTIKIIEDTMLKVKHGWTQYTSNSINKKKDSYISEAGNG